MTETEYVLSVFDERMKRFRDKRIVIHGSRGYAQAIASRFGGSYNFVGVMSRDPVPEGVFCGLPVYPEAALSDLRPDMLLLTERVRHAEAVYADLHAICERSGILLYDMYGLDEAAVHREIFACRRRSPEEWKAICLGYDAVAFEVMDTLFSPALITGDMIASLSFSELIPWLRSQGKEIFYSLRKSFPEEKQLSYLRAAGFVGEDETNVIRRRGEDLSFRALRAACSGRMLYIGEGLVNECILPRCYGIDTYRHVRSGLVQDMRIPAERRRVQTAYDPGRRAAVQAHILRAATVSFDVFDTLLVRKTLRPGDVFVLTERKAKGAGVPAEGFAQLREAAEHEAAGRNLDAIYEKLRNVAGWDETVCEALKRLELETERMVLVPRKETADLLRFAAEQGKDVVLTSDMYLPGETIAGLLKEKGIAGFARVYVSCEWGKDKRGGLFRVLREQGLREPILHIGDDPEADGAAAQAAGLETEILPSALAIAAEQGWEESIRLAETPEERCLVATMIAGLFRDPFQNPVLEALPLPERRRRFARGPAGAILVGWLTWLIRKLKDGRYDGVWFPARDGWLLMQVYEAVRPRFGLPPAAYVYANRHVTFLCCADRENTLDHIETYVEHTGLGIRNALERLYGFTPEEAKNAAVEESLSCCVRRHMPRISRIAREAREGFFRHLADLGIHAHGSYALVDFVTVGTVQRMLSLFAPHRLRGLYFASHTPGIVGGLSEYYLDSRRYPRIVENYRYIELESFFCSPEPSVDRLDADGKPVFFPETRTEEELRQWEAAWEEAEAFALAFFNDFYQESAVISPALLDAVYAVETNHRVQENAYDDWSRMPIPIREDDP